MVHPLGGPSIRAAVVWGRCVVPQAHNVAIGPAGPLGLLKLPLLAEVLELEAEDLPEGRAGQAVDQDVGWAAEGQEDSGDGASHLEARKIMELLASQHFYLSLVNMNKLSTFMIFIRKK